MACCRQEGKDRIISVTKENHETPSNAELVADDPSDPYEEHGLILPHGETSAGTARALGVAFSCFHCSTEDVKGSDCVDQFRAMQECMQQYPDLYPQEEEKPADRLKESAASEAIATKEKEGSS